LAEALLKVVEEVCYKMFDCRHSPFFKSTPAYHVDARVYPEHGEVIGSYRQLRKTEST